MLKVGVGVQIRLQKKEHNFEAFVSLKFKENLEYNIAQKGTNYRFILGNGPFESGQRPLKINCSQKSVYSWLLILLYFFFNVSFSQFFCMCVCVCEFMCCEIFLVLYALYLLIVFEKFNKNMNKIRSGGNCPKNLERDLCICLCFTFVNVDHTIRS